MGDSAGSSGTTRTAQIMDSFMQPMQVPSSLFRDLKLKRKKLSSTAWSDNGGKSVCSSTSDLCPSEDLEPVESQPQCETVNESNCEASSAPKTVEATESQQAAQLVMTQGPLQGMVSNVSSRGQNGETSMEIGTSEYPQADMSSSSMMGEAAIAIGTASMPENSNPSESPPQTTIATTPAMCVPPMTIPQVVAFAAMPNQSTGEPQVVAVAAMPGAKNVVALPLCNWPYNPMMLSSLSNSQGETSDSGVDTSGELDRQGSKTHGHKRAGVVANNVAPGTSALQIADDTVLPPSNGYIHHHLLQQQQQLLLGEQQRQLEQQQKELLRQQQQQQQQREHQRLLEHQQQQLQQEQQKRQQQLQQEEQMKRQQHELHQHLQQQQQQRQQQFAQPSLPSHQPVYNFEKQERQHEFQVVPGQKPAASSRGPGQENFDPSQPQNGPPQAMHLSPLAGGLIPSGPLPLITTANGLTIASPMIAIPSVPGGPVPRPLVSLPSHPFLMNPGIVTTTPPSHTVSTPPEQGLVVNSLMVPNRPSFRPVTPNYHSAVPNGNKTQTAPPHASHQHHMGMPNPMRRTSPYPHKSQHVDQVKGPPEQKPLTKEAAERLALEHKLRRQEALNNFTDQYLPRDQIPLFPVHSDLNKVIFSSPPPL